MKKIFLIITLLVASAEAKTVALVHYDPFKKAKVLLKSDAKRVPHISHRKKPLRIDAILNKKVYINGKFYGVGKTVDGYKIVTITNKYIKVTKNRRILTIPLIKSHYLDDSIDNIKLF